MRYGTVDSVKINDFKANEAIVDVRFYVVRSALFEFMDALNPIDPDARREPILAILEHSAQGDDDEVRR